MTLDDDEDQLTLTDIRAGTGRTDSDDPEFIVVVHRPSRGELSDPIRCAIAVAGKITGVDTLDVSERARLAHGIAAGDIEIGERAEKIRGGGLAAGVTRDSVDSALSVAGATESIEHVVVDNIATFGQEVGVIRSRAQRVVDAGATLHLVEEGVDITPDNADTVLGVLGGLDTSGIELERETRVQDVQEWLDETKARGRPPLGFENKDGERIPAENYDEVRSVLSMWPGSGLGEISKRKAADRLGVSTRTITRAMDNIERYGLRPPAEGPEEMPGGERV
jgi:DNA invertase Pin-like site-specific DNA recombinase